MSSAPNPQSDADQLEAAADQAIAACGGDAREAVKALIVANHFLALLINVTCSASAAAITSTLKQNGVELGIPTLQKKSIML
jgi:hypothetical protein